MMAIFERPEEALECHITAFTLTSPHLISIVSAGHESEKSEVQSASERRGEVHKK